jgi:hypothetical protein
MAGFAEHRGGARGHAAIRMRRRILITGVGFHLHDPPRAAVIAHQQFVQQLGRHLGRVALIEAPRQNLPRLHDLPRNGCTLPVWNQRLLCRGEGQCMINAPPSSRHTRPAFAAG